jgi:hypothetical protein
LAVALKQTRLWLPPWRTCCCASLGWAWAVASAPFFSAGRRRQRKPMSGKEH